MYILENNRFWVQKCREICPFSNVHSLKQPVFNAEKYPLAMFDVSTKNLVASQFFRAKVIQFSGPRRETFLAWENYSLPLLSSLSIVGESFQTKVGTVFNDVSFFPGKVRFKRRIRYLFLLKKGDWNQRPAALTYPTLTIIVVLFGTPKKSVGWQVNCFADHFSSQLEQIHFFNKKENTSKKYMNGILPVGKSLRIAYKLPVWLIR